MAGTTNFAHLLPPFYKEDTIKPWLKEDIPNFDYSGYVVGDQIKTATLYAKSAGVLAGVPFFNDVMKEVGCTVEWNYNEGDLLAPEGHSIALATVHGAANSILIGERTALNILSRCSGISTRCHEAKLIGVNKGWKGKIAITRKTTPGFRIVEKYAALVGGCDPHRMNLSSMCMLKDNAIQACGGVFEAVARAKKVAGFSVKIEVEARNAQEAYEAAQAGADVVMLDNFSAEEVATVAHSLRNLYPSILIEVSGGVTVGNAEQFMVDSVDIISMGCLTHSSGILDFSLKIN